MAEGFKEANIPEISNLLGDYFDGLYEGDIQKFSSVFHPESHLLNPCHFPWLALQSQPYRIQVTLTEFPEEQPPTVVGGAQPRLKVLSKELQTPIHHLLSIPFMALRKQVQLQKVKLQQSQNIGQKTKRVLPLRNRMK